MRNDGSRLITCLIPPFIPIPMKTVFLSFADSRMYKAVQRLRIQAEGMRFFDKIHVCNEHDLDDSFRSSYGERMYLGSRGFGYWVWKPYLIRRVFDELMPGDLLFYCDAGCHWNPAGRWRLKFYAERLREATCGVMGFQLEVIHPEFRWTKGDLLDYFAVRGDRNLLLSPQICSTHAFFCKNKLSSDFLHQWQLPYQLDFSLVDDTPSRSPNFPGFVEHRHDQSIFSILCKRMGAEILSGQETYSSRWEDLMFYPIHDRRSCWR